MKTESRTIIRTIVLAVALINQTLTAMGRNPLPWSDESIYELATLLVTIGISIWTAWKNNSFTKNAIKADNYLKELNEQGE